MQVDRLALLNGFNGPVAFPFLRQLQPHLLPIMKADSSFSTRFW